MEGKSPLLITWRKKENLQRGVSLTGRKSGGFLGINLIALVPPTDTFKGNKGDGKKNNSSRSGGGKGL